MPGVPAGSCSIGASDRLKDAVGTRSEYAWLIFTAISDIIHDNMQIIDFDNHDRRIDERSKKGRTSIRNPGFIVLPPLALEWQLNRRSTMCLRDWYDDPLPATLRYRPIGRSRRLFFPGRSARTLPASRMI